jgi:hypothetical protein
VVEAEQLHNIQAYLNLYVHLKNACGCSILNMFYSSATLSACQIWLVKRDKVSASVCSDAEDTTLTCLCLCHPAACWYFPYCLPLPPCSFWISIFFPPTDCFLVVDKFTTLWTASARVNKGFPTAVFSADSTLKWLQQGVGKREI